MDKPTKPTNLVPRTFGGVKNNFSSSLQISGYENNVPAILGGDNLNYVLDGAGGEFDYCEKIVDFICAMPIGKIVTTDSNNKLVYSDNIPSQTGNNNKFLMTNGSSMSWKALTMVDGEFYIGDNIEINTSTARGTYNVSLASILPNDSYNYLCLFKYVIERQDNSRNDSTYGLKVGSKTYLFDTVEGDPNYATNRHRVGGQVTMIVDTNRQITITIGGDVDLTNSSLELLAYRKLGTSS